MIRRILLISSLLALFTAQVVRTQSTQPCNPQISCGDCIRAGCVWCFEPNFGGIRCQTEEDHMTSTCPQLEVPQTRNATETVTVMDPISISNINLNLRVGEPQSFEVRVTPQRNLPLDLYVLSDLSGSMEDELEALQAVAGDIATNIGNITTNVRLGFGSFNDKVTRPYTFVVDEQVCSSSTSQSTDGCDEGYYAFRHQITLTDDIALYDSTLQAVTNTQNVDDPENGLEGLAQVVACEDIIGWRARNATGRERGRTRIVLFLTDAHFHYSGEGILAGILAPYNGECNLVPGPDPIELTTWDQFDYPSVGRIADMLLEKNVIVIFAATGRIVDVYEQLVEIINSKFNGGTRLATLTSNSQEVLELIRREYESILQTVSFSRPITDDLRIDISVMCPNSANATSNGLGCEGVPLDETAVFNVTVTLTNCEALQDRSEAITTVTGTFGSFTITYSGICNCACEETSVPASSQCSGMGNLTCSVCECDAGKCGVDCSIDIGDRDSAECPRGGLNEEQCSGRERGMCDCNCICNDSPDTSNSTVLGTILSNIIVDRPDFVPSIFGNACQCDNFVCDFNDAGDVCSGRGMCCDGRCVCGPTPQGNVYNGPNGVGEPGNCECLPPVEACQRDLQTDVDCNGRGTCGCVKCNCNNTYFGNFCQCPNYALENACTDVTDRCVLCALGYSNDCSECTEECLPVRLIEADVLQPEISRQLQILSLAANDPSPIFADTTVPFSANPECERFVDGCMYNYFVLVNTTQFIIIAVNDRMCDAITLPGGLPIWALAPILLAALLALGILILIIIKILFVILDYIEVKKWEKEAKDADFSKNQNPLYQSPEMKYENVAYGKE